MFLALLLGLVTLEGPGSTSAVSTSFPVAITESCQDDPDCNDGDYCNGVETCVGEICQAGTPVTCKDSNDCTLDTCNEISDSCEFTPLAVDTPCGDADPCTGAELCDGSGACQAATPVDCTYLDTTCVVGVCNPLTQNCEAQDRPDLAICGDDGDSCDGEDICQTGFCVNDTSVSVVTLVPMAGVTNIAGFRARDIANNDYTPRFYTAIGDPDYTASDYSLGHVEVTFGRTGVFFSGHIEAGGLKPNFAYQVKLVGMPTGEFGTAGDDGANERIGYAGRWFKVGAGNSNDAAYEACKSDPLCTDIYQGYLVFDFFTTDRFGTASHDFVADQSLHVLWRICPPELPLTGCGGGGGTPSVYQDVVAKAVTGYGYGQDNPTWNIGVYGEIERNPPAAWLADGEYRARMILTEESFHESGVGGQWASAVGESGIHFWINQAEGPRDCDDFDLCNGYESCDGLDVCQSGTAASCDDGDLCTADLCDAKFGCSHTDISGSCDDGVVCTQDSCDSQVGCVHQPDSLLCGAGETCDAGAGCIILSSCFSDPECDDGQFCNGNETCDLGTNNCLPGTAVTCDDGQFCNGSESCNEGTDSCDPGSAPVCDDGDGATIDYCDPATGGCESALSFEPGDGTITDSMWPSGMELGGIGTGKVEIRTNGELGNYTINNNWDIRVERTKGTFFALHLDSGGIKETRVLRTGYSGGSEYSGVASVDHVRYMGMFPKLEIEYFDALPVTLRLDAFSPLIPQNPLDSGLPVAFFTFEVENESTNSLDISLAFSWENILGRGGYDTWSNGSATWNSIQGNFQENVDLANLKGIHFRTTQSYGSIRDNTVGEYLLLAEKGTGLAITSHNSWNVLDATPAFWSEFADDGLLIDPVSPPAGSDGSYQPGGALAVKVALAPLETRQIRFMVVWFMPTHITAGDGLDHGHAYMSRPETDTAQEIAEYAHSNLSALLADTNEWHDLVLASNLPFWLKLRMINGAFTMFANSVYPEDRHFYTHESLISMRGSLGTSDQRMAFHPYYTMLFPGLDQDELTIFGDVRPGDGRISHFNGNVGWKLHSSDVGYGVTNWPDLSCSYVMQVLKSYKWTGNTTFLDDNWNEVKGAMAWLESADADGDFIPEGGSTYDYEGQNPGAFIYTASAYLGALKAAEEMARIKGDTPLADGYAARFTSAQTTVMTNLWTGEYFKKYHRPSDGYETPNSFIASLAGDWLSRYSTTGRTLDADVTKSAVNHILNRHQDLFAGVVPPMEVAPDGSDPAGNCYQYQHEPYIGMESIYNGFVDEGLQILYSIYEDHWEKAHWPWNGRIHPSVYGGGKTGGWNGDYYMSNPATWSVLNALSGSSIDVPNETLYLAPHLPAGWSELHIPVFFPRFWGWLDFDHATGQIDLEIIKTFGTPLTISKTTAELASGVIVENTSEGLPFTASVGQTLTYHIPVDNSLPAAVGDLSGTWVSDEVRLQWTAPGDDGSTGRSLRYDIRYALTPITPANWDADTQIIGETYPVTGGTQELYVVPDNLAPDSTYHFALKSKDEESNWSALSNVEAVYTGETGCTSDPECYDGVYCNGQETCDGLGQCQSGTPVDCSHLDLECTSFGVCDEGTESCVANPVADGSACDDGNVCTPSDQCWSGVCQTQSLMPVLLEFDGSGGGVQDKDGEATAFTHLIPSTNGGYVAADLDLAGGVLTVTTNEGDFGRASDSSQNDQDNPLAVLIDAAGSAPFRVAGRLVAPWDIEDDYQSAGVLFGVDEDNYVKFAVFHNHSAFGGAENNDPDSVGFQVGIERSSSPGSVEEHNTAYPAADGFQSVAAMDLFLELDPVAETATACYRADGGVVTVIESDLAISPATSLFSGCAFAGLIHTNNDYMSPGGDPENSSWHPNFDWISVSSADADGDGYTVCGNDWDDGDDSVYPGAAEICDGLDNNQDGTVDEGGDALCDDGNACTVDTCAGAAGCVYSGDCHGIQGTITYYRGTGGQEPGSTIVGDVTLDLLGQTASESTTSDLSTGDYGFQDLPSEAMTVTPSKTGDVDGVSSLDAARVSQSRVGLVVLTPNQATAGDVSGNGTVSSYDASLISQFRVGMITKFPVAVTRGSDWAFTPDERTYDPLDGLLNGEDYLAIVYGDVTGNWSPPAATSVPGMNLEAAPEPSPPPVSRRNDRTPAARSGRSSCALSLRPEENAGSSMRTLALHGRGCQGLLGLDLTLGYDPRVVSIEGSARAPMTSSFEMAQSDHPGRYEVSLYAAEALQGDGELMIFQVQITGRTVRRVPIFIQAAEINEGQIEVRILSESGRPSRSPGHREVER